MTDTLRLDDDMEGIELLEAVEEAFGVKLSNHEAEQCLTVGNLYDIVQKNLPPFRERGGPCLTAVTFFRLRRAIAERGPRLDLRPQTRLADLITFRDSKEWWRHLEESTGFRLPPLAVPSSVLRVTLVALAATVVWGIMSGGLISLAWLVPLILALASCWVLDRVVPQMTLGDLARLTTALNFRHLADEHRVLRPQEVWESLILIIRDYTGQNIPISRDTRLIA